VVTGVDAEAYGLFWRIKENVAIQRAWDEINAQLPAIEWQTSQEVAGRFQAEIDARVQGMLGDANAELEATLFGPFRALGAADAALLTRSSAAQVEIATPQGAALPARGVAGDVEVRIDAALANRLMAAKLAGKSYSETEVAALFHVDRPAPAADDREVTVTFPAARPFELAFHDGKVQVVMRSAKYTRGDETLPPMTVMATYDVTGGKMVREGELTVCPPRDEDDPARNDLTLNEKALKQVLKRKMGAFFKPEMPLDAVPLPGMLATAGALTVKSLEAREGAVAVTADWSFDSRP
jgi:hypothetical protein